MGSWLKGSAGAVAIVLAGLAGLAGIGSARLAPLAHSFGADSQVSVPDSTSLV